MPDSCVYPWSRTISWSCVMCCIRDRLPSTDRVYTGFQVSQLPWLNSDKHRMHVACDANMVMSVLVMEWREQWSSKYGMSLRSTSLDTVRHVRHSLVNYISLNIDDSNVWFHFLWWDCIPASFCCTSASTYTRDKGTINMAMTCMVFCKWGHIYTYIHFSKIQ